MVNKVAELELELRRMREDVNIWDLLGEHRLPYGHERHLRAIVASMGEQTPYSDIIEAFNGIEPFYLEGAEKVVPRPLSLLDLSKDAWRSGYVQTSCACLSQASELHRLATQATPEVRPLLHADSQRLLLTFFLRTVSRFERVPPDLGVIVDFDGTNVGSAKIEVNPYGFIPTVATTLSALERPSVFTPIIPDVETYREDRWSVYEQRTDLSLEKLVRVDLLDLVSYDFEADSRVQTMKWMIEEFHTRYVETSKLLRDLLLTAAGAEIARREPAVWREFLRGESTEAGRFIEAAYGGLRDSVRTVAEILQDVEVGEKSAYVATGYHYV
jgi:hypothetical protein